MTEEERRDLEPAHYVTETDGAVNVNLHALW